MDSVEVWRREAVKEGSSLDMAGCPFSFAVGALVSCSILTVTLLSCPHLQPRPPENTEKCPRLGRAYLALTVAPYTSLVSLGFGFLSADRGCPGLPSRESSSSAVERLWERAQNCEVASD